jgi:hypothetical protein
VTECQTSIPHQVIDSGCAAPGCTQFDLRVVVPGEGWVPGTADVIGQAIEQRPGTPESDADRIGKRDRSVDPDQAVPH